MPNHRNKRISGLLLAAVWLLAATGCNTTLVGTSTPRTSIIEIGGQTQSGGETTTTGEQSAETGDTSASATTTTTTTRKTDAGSKNSSAGSTTTSAATGKQDQQDYLPVTTTTAKSAAALTWAGDYGLADKGDDGCVYFVNRPTSTMSGKLYKWNEGMSKAQEVSGTNTYSFINVENGWIYYSRYSTAVTGGIWRMKTDGTGAEKLTDTTGIDLTVVDGTGWFIDAADHKRIYRMNMTTGALQSEVSTTEQIIGIEVDTGELFYQTTGGVYAAGDGRLLATAANKNGTFAVGESKVYAWTPDKEVVAVPRDGGTAKTLWDPAGNTDYYLYLLDEDDGILGCVSDNGVQIYLENLPQYNKTLTFSLNRPAGFLIPHDGYIYFYNGKSFSRIVATVEAMVAGTIVPQAINV